MENLVNFWQGKTVFVTGHTGFKGGWLALWLKHMQANVVGFSLAPPTEKNFFTETRLANELIDIRGDVRDFAALNHALETHQPDIIFHLAAQPLVRYSYENPVETYATNVMGTVNLLTAARAIKSVRTIVNVTTDKCYENKEWHWGYRENEPMGGYDPYSSSKGCAELVTSAFRNSYFNHEQKIGLASARAGNVIGGGDWALDRLVPDLVTACANADVLKIRYPNAIRPWQHVLEPVSGYLQLAQALYLDPARFAESWNFGPNDSDAKPVSWIADEVMRLWGGDAQWELIDGPKLHEATYLKLDCSKAHAKLQWQPKWDISEALAKTVEWYQASQRGEEMRVVTLRQIAEFVKK